MKRIFGILALSITVMGASAQVDGYTGASTPSGNRSTHSLAELKETVIPKGWNSDSTEYDSFNRYRFGGYGEIVAAFKNYGINRFKGTSTGNAQIKRNTISIPRFVIAGDVKFNKHWILGAEIEFEAGGTGTAVEIENTENGEYETEIEKGGEVALEQFHITYHMNQYFNVRAGHMIVPVGLTNWHHEPNMFFGTIRPEGETTMLPSTWHETGLGMFGQFGRRWASFQWNAMIVAGLNANGFNRNEWAGKAKQGFFETDNFTSPAYAFRFSYTGVPGLRLGASLYYCPNVCANSDKPQTYSFKCPVTIWSADAEYVHQYFIIRGNFMQGYLNNSSLLSQKNTMLSNLSPYTRTAPIAHQSVSYGTEAGLRLKGFLQGRKAPDIVAFGRYEYYNTQEDVAVDNYSSSPADPRLKTSMWVVGLNYKPVPYVILKTDYTHRTIGNGRYNNENEFAVGVAFCGWFFSDNKKFKWR